MPLFNRNKQTPEAEAPKVAGLVTPEDIPEPKVIDLAPPVWTDADNRAVQERSSQHLAAVRTELGETAVTPTVQPPETAPTQEQQPK